MKEETRRFSSIHRASRRKVAAESQETADQGPEGVGTASCPSRSSVTDSPELRVCVCVCVESVESKRKGWTLRRVRASAWVIWLIQTNRARQFCKKRKMSVRFAAAPKVVTYKLDERERKLKRAGSSQLNVEYQRERKLYSLVLSWKHANPKDSAMFDLKARSLDQFLGMKRGRKAALLLGNQNSMAAFVEAVSAFVLEKWPRTNCDEMKVGNNCNDPDLSSMIVLRLVAEFLCQHFRYELNVMSEQHSLYFACFHLVQHLMNSYYF